MTERAQWIEERAESLLDWLDPRGRLMRQYALERITECLAYVGENYALKADAHREQGGSGLLEPRTQGQAIGSPAATPPPLASAKEEG